MGRVSRDTEGVFVESVLRASQCAAARLSGPSLERSVRGLTGPHIGVRERITPNKSGGSVGVSVLGGYEMERSVGVEAPRQSRRVRSGYGAPCRGPDS